MTRFATILLLCFYLTGVFEMKQWVKIPVLYHHFVEHEAHEKLSFLDFLNLHYNHVTTDEHHENEHRQLPFNDAKTHSVFLFAADDTFKFLDCSGIGYRLNHMLLSSPVSAPLPESFGKAVWQPPRLWV